MRKVRVLKEMPRMKVGDLLELHEHSELNIGFNLTPTMFPIYRFTVKELIRDGWLEWAEEDLGMKCDNCGANLRIQVFGSGGGKEEKSLEDIFKDHFPGITDEHCQGFALLATDRFKKKFDEACRGEGADHSKATGWLNIRKAMFGKD